MSSVLTPSVPSSSQSDLEPRHRRWTREEFDRLGDLGWFRGQRTELIEGEIMVLSPQGPSHSYVTDHVAGVLRIIRMARSLGPHATADRFWALLRARAGRVRRGGNEADYRDAHPTFALLIVEVSDSTLAYDRGRKASLYAMRGIGDYWIVNLQDMQLEVRRDPRPDPSQPFGYGYASLAVFQSDALVSPLAASQLSIAVADLLA